ncbi:phage holin family protein [uncultured Subdoligranulum sp.]|uniref:phage holin family protein n=1 Tax=uncultured Subdoligranulum sp. TaxID=512298 RepID=UPI00261297C0|nr:phage holin family protein [uncultured Subdoligranulum sp.]
MHLHRAFSKAGMIVVVLVAALADRVLAMAVTHLPGLDLQYTTLVLPVILVWYIFTELGSIAENAADMGAPVPAWLIKLLAEQQITPPDDTDDDL